MKRSTPKWVSWLMWSLVAMIIIRKLELYIFALYDTIPVANGTALQLVVLCSLLGGALIEIVIIYCQKFGIFKRICYTSCIVFYDNLQFLWILSY